MSSLEYSLGEGNTGSMELHRDDEIKFDDYLRTLSPNAKTALEGMVKAAIYLRSWNDKAKITGEGELTFNTSSQLPRDLLSQIIESADIISRDMGAAEEHL